MPKQKKQFIQDLIIVAISIYIAVFLTQAGILSSFIDSLQGYEYLGILLAGLFFTSVFTTAPAIALLVQFSHTTNPAILAIIGGLGSVLGDYIIFKFVKDRVSQDLEYLLSTPQTKRFATIFQTRLFKFFAPFLGALIIASPLPDELGVTILGMSKISDKNFFPISFILNGLGILIIAIVANL